MTHIDEDDKRLVLYAIRFAYLSCDPCVLCSERILKNSF